MICSFTIHVYNHLCTSFSPLDGKCVPTVLVCLLFCGSFYRPCGTWFEYLRTWSCPLLPVVVAVGETFKNFEVYALLKEISCGQCDWQAAFILESLTHISQKVLKSSFFPWSIYPAVGQMQTNDSWSDFVGRYQVWSLKKHFLLSFSFIFNNALGPSLPPLKVSQKGQSTMLRGQC